MAPDNGHNTHRSKASSAEHRSNDSGHRSADVRSAHRTSDGGSGHRSDDRTSNGHRSRPARSPSPMELARYAAEQLAELVGREPEGIVSLERTDDGWCIGVEVVETRRIPDTADILAEYAVDVDRSGDLIGYHRTRRYSRGRAQEDR